MKKDLKHFEELAIKGALKAGKVLLSYFNSTKKFKIKDQAGLVTKADTDSEDVLRALFAKETPDFGFLGEEKGTSGSKKTRWIVDPLDGTTNFFHGFPHFNISIGLEYEGNIVVGVVYAPAHGDIYHTRKGNGAFKNKKPIHVSKAKALSTSMLGTGFAYIRGKSLRKELELFNKFTNLTHGIRRPGAAALDLCYLAEGIYDGFYERTLNPWDVAAGSLLILEAGGKLSNYEGGKFSVYEKEIVGSNSLIHKEMIKILNS